MHYIIGGGIAGLIWAFYNQQYKIIAPDIGGQMKTKFDLGPRYLHKTPQSKKLLQELDMPIKIIKIKVGYYCCGMLASDTIAFPAFRELYYQKSRNTKDLKGFDKSTMTGNKNEFEAYEVDFNQLIANLYAAIGPERIIRGKVISINTDRQYLVYANGNKAGRKTTKKKYNKIIWTAPLKFFMLMMYGQEEADAIITQDITYTLLNRSPFHFGKHFNYVYVVDPKHDFHRITKTRQGYVVDVCGTKPIQSKYAIDYVTLRGAQLCSKIPPPRIARIKFVGRYARNNHKIKTEDIIKQAMEEKR